MKKPIERVCCGTCRGAGTVPLSRVYAETLRGLRLMCAYGRYVVANRDAESFGCKGTALSNRLKFLEKYGFAISELVGKERRFKVKHSRGDA